MTFSQLIELTEMFYLKNDTQNVLKKLAPDPSQKVKIESISESKVLYSLFLLKVEVEGY